MGPSPYILAEVMAETAVLGYEPKQGAAWQRRPPGPWVDCCCTQWLLLLQQPRLPPGNTDVNTAGVYQLCLFRC